jgi:hypothetical protein
MIGGEPGEEEWRERRLSLRALADLRMLRVSIASMPVRWRRFEPNDWTVEAAVAGRCCCGCRAGAAAACCSCNGGGAASSS